ncbi:MAG: VWA domain-containing protein [Methanomassiliicoccus sp.]|nr:VWA domain-containing protein [Methanomassiliicoccus sp.]
MAAGTYPIGMRKTFPLSAVVGQENVKKALLCALASDSINGVLITGPVGTAKSTLARALDDLIPGRKIINLPLNATEEQIIGGLDLEVALTTGKKRSLSSVLDRADGNILYIDSINLLPERLIHTIMDASIEHRSLVEREGISSLNECRFLLVGTMDPEEGELSPHLLDRFDVCVSIAAANDVEQRVEILRRGLRYDSNPAGFQQDYEQSEEELRDMVLVAREKAPYVLIPPGHYDAIARLCQDLGVEGHRGDIALARTVSALAALHGHDQITLEDLKEAVPLCLEHRRRDQCPEEQPPFPESSPPPSAEDQRQDEGERPPERPDEPSNDKVPESMQPPPSDGKMEDKVFSVGRPFAVVDYIGEDRRRKALTSAHGRRDRIVTSDRSGRYTSFQVPQGKLHDVAFDASIRAAAPYQRSRHRNGVAVALELSDIREKVRERKRGTRILFLVDASGSMGAQQRMIAVKGAILALLKDAYQKRDEVGMVSFRKDAAEVTLPMTRSVLIASRKLEEMPTGGRTPLAQGLAKGCEMLLKDASPRSGCDPVMVILTDGRANVPMNGGKPVQEAIDFAHKVSATGIRFVVVDTGAAFPRLDLALRLCMALEGTYFRLEELDASYLASSVRAIVGR